MTRWETTLREAVATLLPDANERLAESLIDYLNLLLKRDIDHFLLMS